jgi:hypothetical protein
MQYVQIFKGKMHSVVVLIFGAYSSLEREGGWEI